MAEPRWASIQSVQEAWLGEPMQVKDSTLKALICRAERRLAREVPNLQSRIDSGLEDNLRDTVADVVASMVERKLRNPDGTRSITSVTGPFTDTRTVGGDNPGEIWVTAEELAQLAPPFTRGKAFAVDAYDVHAFYRDPWKPRPLPPGADPLKGARVNGPTEEDEWP